MGNDERSEQLEYAVTAFSDGRQASRTAAQRDLAAFREAIRKAGGRPPLGRNGKRQQWSRDRGWFDDVRDPLTDRFVRFLSPTARAQHAARREAEADAALLADARAGRRPRDLEVCRAMQRQVERELAADRRRRTAG